jgi:hypothetical protein
MTKLRPSGNPEEQFGFSAALSGDYAIVGAPGNPSPYNPQTPGSAYIYMREGTHWLEEAHLTASDGANGDAFGYSVSIEGDRVIVGAPYDDDDRPASGSAYVFKRGELGWFEEAKLNASDPGGDDRFGFGVSISGEHILVGAPADDDIARASGASYFFKWDSLGWFEVTKLIEDGDHTEDLLGSKVSISGDHAVVGTGIGGSNPHFPAYGYAFAYSELDPVGPIAVGVTVSPPSGSGTFDYTIELTNTQDTIITRDIWIETRGPGGERRTGQVISGRTLNAGETYVRSGTHGLGAGSPLGVYRFYAFVGHYPDFVMSSGSAPFVRTTALVGELERTASPIMLFQNHPNPFNPSTTFRYSLNEDTHVSLQVYSLLGQLVATVVDEGQVAGYKTVVWDGSNDIGQRVASGVYIYRLTAGSLVETKSMILLK